MTGSFDRFIAGGLAAALAMTMPGARPAWAQDAQPAPLSAEAARANDARSYARDYKVSQQEALRRLTIMAEAGEQIAALTREAGDRFSGIYFDNGADFRLVVRTTGTAAPARTQAIGGAELPIRFETAAVTLSAALAAMRDGIGQIRTLFPTLQAVSYDERTGEVVVLLKGLAAAASTLKAKAPELATLLKVPVRIDVENATLAPAAVRGGTATYLSNGDPWCTTAFVGTNASGQSGVFTAGHCTTQTQYWKEGTALTAFTATTLYDGNKDLAFMRNSVATVPQFVANTNEAPRVLKGRRTKANTAVGNYICFYGRNTGPINGQTCGEVTSKAFNPNYGPPSSPYGCSNGPSNVPCNANFVEVRPRAGETPYCRGGDSGSPVFVFDVAWGVLSGCASYSNNTIYNFVYTSMDEAYAAGYSLTYG